MPGFYWIAIEQHWKSSQRRRNTYMYYRLFSMQLPERHSWNYTLSIFFVCLGHVETSEPISHIMMICHCMYVCSHSG